MAQMFEIMNKKKGRKISLIDPTSTYEKHALWEGTTNIETFYLFVQIILKKI